MTKTWRIIAITKRLGGGPPLKEYFLVAISNQAAALDALRAKRPELSDAELTIDGEATPEYVKWLDVKGGEVFCVLAIS